MWSEKMGITSPKIVQIDSIDNRLKNRLWSAFVETVVVVKSQDVYHGPPVLSPPFTEIAKRIWDEFLGMRIDEMSHEWEEFSSYLRERLYLHSEWYEYYNFIQFVVEKQLELRSPVEPFLSKCNVVLSAEKAAYRFVGDQLVPITDDTELGSIGETQEIVSDIEGVREHIRAAIALLADREKPDYRNSTKESISSVEALIRLVTKKRRATLAEGLKLLRKRGFDIHPALEQAWDKLYGYTSDEEGVRHAITDDPEKIDFALAKYMLVSCSVFINYLIARCADLGIDLSPSAE